ncbi:MAG TPA: hypothetical protein VHH32_01575, partial [Gemmatimonadales bacterium]|nr:hypothetical protein [Gemmatimonadales bacterium]
MIIASGSDFLEITVRERLPAGLPSAGDFRVARSRRRVGCRIGEPAGDRRPNASFAVGRYCAA